MIFVPQRPCGDISDEIITSMVNKQSHFLSNTMRTVIPLNSLFFSETWVYGDNIGDCWRREFTEVTSNGSPIYTSIDTGPTDKFFVLYEKCIADMALQYIQHFKDENCDLGFIIIEEFLQYIDRWR